MEVRCANCGNPVRIESHQLGKTLGCPHCQQPLPPAASPSREAAERIAAATDSPPPPHPRQWLKNSLSTLSSVVIHAGLLLVFALISYGQPGVPQQGEEVSIGTLPEIVLDESSTELEAEPERAESADTELSMELELAAPESLTSSAASDSFGADAVAPTATAMGGGDLDLGAVGVGGAMQGGGSWEGMLQNLRRNGLDVVIAFDSTSSMGPEISVVKSQVERIGKTLIKLIPKARVSLCTYRDFGDRYVVRGIPLTSDVGRLREFLYGVSARGGGDGPEAVQEGLRWAMTQNDFHTRARKVVLVFGDAPPHREDLPECLKMASDFAQRDNGIVSTVTCRRGRPMSEFIDISRAGGGEAFLTTDERQIMTQLIVLVFGAQHRAKVLEAFELMR